MILNDYITFLRNIKYFFIFYVLITTTPRFSIAICESNQSEQPLCSGRRGLRSTLRKRSNKKNKRSIIQNRQENETFTNVTTNQVISDGINSRQNSICNGLCVLGIMVGAVVIIILIGFGLCFTMRKRKKVGDKEIRPSSKRMISSTQTADDFPKISSSPPPFESRLNDEAEAFAQEHPPQEEIPPPEHIVYIQGLGGAKAWEWSPDENLLVQQFVSITNEGSIVTFNKRVDCMVQTNYPFFIPQTEGDTLYEPPFEQPETMELRRGQMLHYFEITVLSNPEGKNTTIAIGLATKPYPYFRLPGWNIYSVGYHSNDGRKFNDAPSGREYGPTWGEVGDTIGCGYNPDVGYVFFTKNGQFLGNAFTSIRHIWFPTIGANGPCIIETNFGDNYDKEFKYESARGYGPGGPLLISEKRRPRPSRSSSTRSIHAVETGSPRIRYD
ncbi:9144_t:CDS:2 [Dentiscutata heterogama]|uniref:9144_t:CDS:1 n=2 Tax=Dentiscutata heterogama TaxID=1316150 RepID=A0ACA9JVY2_9GLOM|nr:9139_t:CDS:2 [Dentiscutata heterogama]CAG8439234.1 9144_t:CDS:2 [Dentiscutata heterogama]